jgi:hypothetical protein
MDREEGPVVVAGRRGGRDLSHEDDAVDEERGEDVHLLSAMKVRDVH